MESEAIFLPLPLNYQKNDGEEKPRWELRSNASYL